MNINRNNYDEFFMLYSDNELSEADRIMVQSFIQKNPDLEEELNILLQSRLVADYNIVFENKSDLLKPEENYGIDIHPANAQEWLVLYTDNELTNIERSAVEKFIALHPDTKKELDIFQKIRLQPDYEITFPGKKSLYRKEEKVRIIPVRWWRVAAAAVLILATGLTAIVLLNNKPVSPVPGDKPVVQSNEHTPKENTMPATEKEPSLILEKVPMVTIKLPFNNDKKQPAPIHAIQKNNQKSPGTILNEEKNLAAGNQKLSNNLPVSEPGILRPENLTDITHVTKNKKTPDPQNKPDFPVTTLVPDTYITHTSTGQKADDAIYAVEMGENKNKLRGFFRKVTRIFERNTQINTTDESDRLLIGGLSLKLK